MNFNHKSNQEHYKKDPIRLEGRSLGHKDRVERLNGKNSKLRAKRDKDGNCIKYKETSL